MMTAVTNRTPLIFLLGHPMRDYEHGSQHLHATCAAPLRPTMHAGDMEVKVVDVRARMQKAKEVVGSVDRTRDPRM